MTATQAPTPGPLSAEDVKLLVKGDLLRCVVCEPSAAWSSQRQPQIGEICRLVAATEDRVTVEGYEAFPGQLFKWLPSRFAFIGRPSADGWMPWSGGENPVPGQVVEVRLRNGREYECYKSDAWSSDWTGPEDYWKHGNDPYFQQLEIIAFRLAPTAPVEASGSERETVFDGNAHDLVQTAQALAIAIERVPDWLMNDNLLTAHCHAQVLIADLPAALRPQPSGETREADDLIDDEWRALVGDGPDAFANPASINHDEFRTAIRGVLSRARPLALGGQQGEVRETIVKTIAFLKRDLDTPRINDTVETLLLDLVKADAILRGEA